MFLYREPHTQGTFLAAVHGHRIASVSQMFQLTAWQSRQSGKGALQFMHTYTFLLLTVSAFVSGQALQCSQPGCSHTRGATMHVHRWISPLAHVKDVVIAPDVQDAALGQPRLLRHDVQRPPVRL